MFSLDEAVGGLCELAYIRPFVQLNRPSFRLNAKGSRDINQHHKTQERTGLPEFGWRYKRLSSFPQGLHPHRLLRKMHIGSKSYGQMSRGKQQKMISHGGTPFSTVGNHFPRWEIIFHDGISCLASRHPSIGASGHLLKGGAAEALVSRGQESRKPEWKMISRQGKWLPTVGNGFRPWEIISPRFYRFPPSM